MTKRKVIKIVICLAIIVVLIGTGFGVYFYHNRGGIVGHVQYGEYYYLTEMRPTARFKGAQMNSSSYFRIKNDGKTGELYLAGLEATTTPIPFIVTNYKEGVKQTIIEFEYLLANGEDTEIQHLTAISTNDGIRINAIESHAVEIVHQNHNNKDAKSLEYSVTILVFKPTQEVA
ncbi:MAG: hypothetical protein J5598_00490 [Clostridia bacterium]|nr:hypothetical protein [Clostridia bacterium]